MRMIAERPVEVEDRVQAGHWEGDLIMGTGNRSAIGTLVERSTRYLILLHLHDGVSSAETVAEALGSALGSLPSALRRTLTWDQGKELAQHQQITANTGTSVFFCDPHSPWQRASNENMNGLLRDYFPKGIDLTAFTRQRSSRSPSRSTSDRARRSAGPAQPTSSPARSCPARSRTRPGASRRNPHTLVSWLHHDSSGRRTAPASRLIEAPPRPGSPHTRTRSGRPQRVLHPETDRRVRPLRGRLRPTGCSPGLADRQEPSRTTTTWSSQVRRGLTRCWKTTLPAT
jgi:hypothetical protein